MQTIHCSCRTCAIGGKRQLGTEVPIAGGIAASAESSSVYSFRTRLPLEAIIHFGKSERAIAIDGINVLDHTAAHRVSKVQAQRKPEFPLVVPADVIERREVTVTTGGPPVEAKRCWLERAAARVPQIILIAQPQTVYVTPHRKRFGRPQHYLFKQVRVVHRVEERKTRVNARRRQYREERAVRVVRRIPIPARVVKPATNPRTYATGKRWLPAPFDRSRTSPLLQFSPTPVLQRAPAQQVECPR